MTYPQHGPRPPYEAPHGGDQPAWPKSKLPLVLGVCGAALALVVVAAILVLVLTSGSGDGRGALGDGRSAPQAPAASSAPGFLGKADAALALDVYEDFLCPACAQFEQHDGDEVVQAIHEGKLRVSYHFLNFLDRSSGSGDYSSRAAGAVTCVLEKASGDDFLRYHAKLFEEGTQPQEGASTDLSNDQLAQIAVSRGISEPAVDCIRQGAKVSDAQAAARASRKQLGELSGGRVATPSVVKDGQLVDRSDKQWLTKLLTG